MIYVVRTCSLPVGNTHISRFGGPHWADVHPSECLCGSDFKLRNPWSSALVGVPLPQGRLGQGRHWGARQERLDAREGCFDAGEALVQPLDLPPHLGAELHPLQRPLRPALAGRQPERALLAVEYIRVYLQAPRFILGASQELSYWNSTEGGTFFMVVSVHKTCKASLRLKRTKPPWSTWCLTYFFYYFYASIKKS